MDDGDDIFEKVSDDGKDILEKVSDDGDDIFEKVSDDTKDILEKVGVDFVFQCHKKKKNNPHLTLIYRKAYRCIFGEGNSCGRSFLEVSVRFLQGVWNVSGRCLECLWKVSGTLL